jgi:hypothetical protein
MTVINMKAAHDPNRKALAAAIALSAGAKRDLRVADEAASLAAQKCWTAQARLDELNKAPHSPDRARAGAFIASVDAGNPCGTEVLERSSVDTRAKIAAAENEFAVWDETRQECDQAARDKEAAVAVAKERVERAARVIICNSDNVASLIDELTALQAEVISARSVLRLIGRHGVNGEMERPLSEQLERLLWRDLMGMESTPASAAWAAAFEELQSNSDAKLPS